MAKIAKPKVDLTPYLNPITGKEPCGPFLRYTDVYDKIREARKEDDEFLPQGVWKAGFKKANWDQVEKICQEALKTKSKDLQIAAWLTEAWLHQEGSIGLTRGLALISELSKTFWKDIHPQITKSGFEHRIGPYDWINTRLSDACQFVLISHPTTRGTTPSRLLDLNEANRKEFSAKVNQSQQRPSGQSSSDMASISSSIGQTPTPFYISMDESCSQALTLITQLETFLQKHMNGEAPSFYRLKEKIESLQRFAQKILAERGTIKETKTVTTPPNIDSETDKDTDRSSPKKSSLGQIKSREQAYAILDEVAAYLENVEPHSPTPYLIRRAITWGNMNLSQVFSDILNNGQDLSLLLDVMDVKKDVQQ